MLLFPGYFWISCQMSTLTMCCCIYLDYLFGFLYFTADYVSTFDVKGKKVLLIDPQALTLLSEQAFTDVSHLLRPSHLQVNMSCLAAWNSYILQLHT